MFAAVCDAGTSATSSTFVSEVCVICKCSTTAMSKVTNILALYVYSQIQMVPLLDYVGHDSLLAEGLPSGGNFAVKITNRRFLRPLDWQVFVHLYES